MMSIGNCTKDTSTSGYFGFVQSNREQKHKTGVIPVKDRDSQLSMLYRNNISYGIILYRFRWPFRVTNYTAMKQVTFLSFYINRNETVDAYLL